jgi:pyruvate/2-oxoglutarate dehydrogenase complex dihydrolipoamide acyltransferase (E2) component
MNIGTSERDIIFRNFQILKFKSENMVPAVTMTVNIKVNQMIKLKYAANKADTGTHITVTHIFMKAVADTLMDYPMMYSFFDGKSVVPASRLVFSIPVDIENHVEYIVIKEPETKTIEDISTECNKELANIRSGNGNFLNFIKQISSDPSKTIGNNFSVDDLLKVQEYYGNFAISNFGSFHIAYGSLVLSKPMVAGLCVGSIEPVIQKDEKGGYVEVMNMPVTVSFDHRVVDGGYAGRFMNALKFVLENINGEA